MSGCLLCRRVFFVCELTCLCVCFARVFVCASSLGLVLWVSFVACTPRPRGGTDWRARNIRTSSRSVAFLPGQGITKSSVPTSHFCEVPERGTQHGVAFTSCPAPGCARTRPRHPRHPRTSNSCFFLFACSPRFMTDSVPPLLPSPGRATSSARTCLLYTSPSPRD